MTSQRLARAIAPFALSAALLLGMATSPRAQETAPSDVPELGAADAEASLPVPAIESIPAPAPPPPPSLPGPVIGSIERAWNVGSDAVGPRAAQTRAAANEVGIESLDALGRALVFGHGDGRTAERRAEAAVVLAPDLPAAHAALASARFESGAWGGAGSAALDAVAAVQRSLTAWLWFSATGWVLLYFALAGGALLYLGVRGAASVSHAAHDIGDRLEGSMPDFSRVALVAALVLLPAALGEGVAGAALALLVLAVWHGRRAQQVALVCAAAAFVVAIHPLTHVAGARLAAIGADPIVDAAVAAEAGSLDPVDAARLVRAAPGPGAGTAVAAEDPLAMFALAHWARRTGNLTEADRRFESLLATEGDDPVVLASAATAKVALGNPKAAVELYLRAIELEPSALLWFNLSQTHGRAIDVEQHDRALAAAQSIDPVAVSALTGRLGESRGGFVADLPLAQDALRARLVANDAHAAAAALRRPFAPGLLGRSFWFALLGFAAAGGLGIVLSRSVEPSTACPDCGTRLCPRCGTARDVGRGGVAAELRCEFCRGRRVEARAGVNWEAGSNGARTPRVRIANALGSILPGLVGRSARRPALGLAAALAAAGALAFGLGAGAVVPDPASAGAAGPIVFGAATAFCVACYAAIAGVTFRLERRRRA